VSAAHPLVLRLRLVTSMIADELARGEPAAAMELIDERGRIVDQLAALSLNPRDQEELGRVSAEGQELVSAMILAQSEISSELAQPAARRKAVRTYRTMR
jgi:hypothetical protein